MKTNTPKQQQHPAATRESLQSYGENASRDAMPCADDELETDLLMQELQSLWDEQSRQISHILSEHPLVRFLGLPQRKSGQSRLAAAYSILTLVNLAASIYSLATYAANPYLQLRILGGLLALTCTFAALHSLLMLNERLEKKGSTNLSTAKQKQDSTNPVPRRRLAALQTFKPSNLLIVTATRRAFTSPLQVAAVSAAALTVLVSLSSFPIGDGYVMTHVGSTDRAAIILNIDQMIAQL